MLLEGLSPAVEEAKLPSLFLKALISKAHKYAHPNLLVALLRASRNIKPLIEDPFSSQLLESSIYASDGLQWLVARADTELPFGRLRLLLRDRCHAGGSLAGLVELDLALRVRIEPASSLRLLSFRLRVGLFVFWLGCWNGTLHGLARLAGLHKGAVVRCQATGEDTDLALIGARGLVSACSAGRARGDSLYTRAGANGQASGQSLRSISRGFGRLGQWGRRHGVELETVVPGWGRGGLEEELALIVGEVCCCGVSMKKITTK
jgi:hypothetical protein